VVEEVWAGERWAIMRVSSRLEELVDRELEKILSHKSKLQFM
jgi:hypothetical protein